jgi:hypothetical protein
MYGPGLRGVARADQKSIVVGHPAQGLGPMGFGFQVSEISRGLAFGV